ncbi:hypothetical protein Barb4_05050 [Bacteroidales bacterium Barb4]|nr:hypothetical protein Barb4_05050 [Bacteroidales bacterium Barb4]
MCMMSNHTLGNRLSKEITSVQSNCDGPNTLASGHRTCQGYEKTLGIRCSIDTIYHAASRKIMVVTTGWSSLG